jgi:tetratricopeptide (TPR) repeat protein
MSDEQSAPEKGRPLLGRVAIGFVLASISWGLLILVLLYGKTSDHAPTVLANASPSQSTSASDEALTAMVAQQIADLGVKPKTVVLPSEQTLDTVTAIKRGDYATASRIVKDVLAHSNLGSWHFYPFDEFMESTIRSGHDPALLEHLNEWLKQDPQSAVAYLLRAEYYRSAAWAARGDDVGWKIPDDQRDLFGKKLDLSTSDVEKSISLDPRIPWSYFLLLQVVSGNTNSREMDAAFQVGIKAYPTYYQLYHQRLYSFTPKWGGSVKDLYAFVDQYAASAPDKSPLKLLYLHLYAYLLDAARVDCGSLKGDHLQGCVNDAMNRTASAALEDGVLKALKLYKVSDPIQYNRALWPILEMMFSPEGDKSAGPGAVLQMAASIMGSDNQMMDQPGHNSYVLDDITAKVWAQIGNTANADKKFREALSDIENTSFPDEARKDEAMTRVYDDMTKFANDTSQFVNIIVYHDAANAVGGSNHSDVPYMKCYALYRLKHFKEAVSECTGLIDGSDNYLQSHYWRAKAYEGLRQWDASLADFGPVADSANNWFRVGAALDMSYIYGQKSDFAGELASMNAHPYLFDAALQPPEDLAVSYNNRCFAYMKLGELQKALDDCTTSLKYGHIPDAFHKQQELLKQLGAKTTS